MNTCPQCHSVYGDDFVYCLNDGTMLASGGEQETVIRPRVSVDPSAEPTIANDTASCVTCGFANRTGSKFCKKCGSEILARPLAAAQLSFLGVAAGPANEPAWKPVQQETLTFKGGLFTPPGDQAATRSAKVAGISPPIIAMAFGGIVIVIVLALYATQSRSDGAGGALVNSNAVANAVNATISSTALTRNFEREYSGQSGPASITMHLKRDGERLTGYVSSNRSTDTLDGTIDDIGDFRATGTEEGAEHRQGIYTGNIDGSGNVSGTWTKIGGRGSASFWARQTNP